MESVVTIHSAALVGVDAFAVDVEVALTNKIPGLKTIGLPDTAAKEGKERILLALRHQELLRERPSVVVNLAPAELRKTGAHYELAIALGILVAADKVARARVERLLVVGELSLHGDIRPVRGVLAMADLARSLGRDIAVPQGNAREATLVDGVTVYAPATLGELVRGLRGEQPLSPYTPAPGPPPAGCTATERVDLAEVRGQLQARRAAEIAAAGGHNLLFVGPPGSGKTMIARRLATILPPLTYAEAVETTRVWSAAGLLAAELGLVTERPFRAPHHSISSAGLVGGYVPVQPGEVSLAHNGVLFLDEMAEFSRHSLESLREPVEQGCIRIVRAGQSCLFPARAVLVAATNPCPCGFLGDPRHSCGCSPGTVARYRERLSGPLLDRVDLHVEVPRLQVNELADDAAGESSRAVRERVCRARLRQQRRHDKTGVASNARLGEKAVRALVPLAAAERRALAQAVERLGLSPRAYFRVLKVARTIADLAGDEAVRLPHILEAVQYRSLDRPGATR